MIDILTFKYFRGQVVCVELEAAYENLQVAINQLVKSEDIISICTETEHHGVGAVSRSITVYKVFFKFGGRTKKEKLLFAAQDRYKELKEKCQLGRKQQTRRRK